MRKLALMLVLVLTLVMAIVLANRCFGLWVLPTSYTDPNSVWTSETSAYDVNLDTYSTGGGKTFGEIDLYNSGIFDCNKVRWYTTSTASDVTCDVNYDGIWHTVFSGYPTNGWNVHEIGSSQTVVGIRLSPTTVAPIWLYEMHFWQPSTAKPTKVTNLSPADSGTNIDIKTLLTWSTGNMLDTDSYNVYLGTDNPPTDIVNGENVSITTYDPLGLPPSKTYYWRIDAKNDYDVNEGDVWSFTTRPPHKTFMPK